ncbi:MAG: SSI family serine proteinase inhibitor [Micromonosporaceae bacterium]
MLGLTALALPVAQAADTETTGLGVAAEVNLAPAEERLLQRPEGPNIALPPDGADILSLSIQSGEGLRRQASLTCAPIGGTHPSPREACAQLASVSGEVGRLPSQDGACTMEIAPVTVTATGQWNGQSRTYHRVFTNLCEAVHATGGVLFNF